MEMVLGAGPASTRGSIVLHTNTHLEAPTWQHVQSLVPPPALPQQHVTSKTKEVRSTTLQRLRTKQKPTRICKDVQCKFSKAGFKSSQLCKLMQVAIR